MGINLSAQWIKIDLPNKFSALSEDAGERKQEQIFSIASFFFFVVPWPYLAECAFSSVISLGELMA